MKALRKIKWLNVLEMLIFIGCLALVIHDLYMITIYSWIKSISVGFTWFGLGTFVLALMGIGTIYEDLEEKANIPTKKRESRRDLSVKYFIKYSLHHYSKKWSSSKGGGKY